MTLGDIIKAFRTSNNLSMRDFNKISGISTAYIGALENNKRPGTNQPLKPTLVMYRKVADAMGMTLEQLLNAVDSDSPISISSTEPLEDFLEVPESSEEKIVSLYKRLSPKDQALLLAIAERMAEDGGS